MIIVDHYRLDEILKYFTRPIGVLHLKQF